MRLIPCVTYSGVPLGRGVEKLEADVEDALAHLVPGTGHFHVPLSGPCSGLSGNAGGVVEWDGHADGAAVGWVG